MIWNHMKNDILPSKTVALHDPKYDDFPNINLQMEYKGTIAVHAAAMDFYLSFFSFFIHSLSSLVLTSAALPNTDNNSVLMEFLKC